METVGDLARYVVKSNLRWINDRRLCGYEPIVNRLAADFSEGVYYIDLDKDRFIRLQHADGTKIPINDYDFVLDYDVLSKSVVSIRSIRLWGRQRLLGELLPHLQNYQPIDPDH